MSYGRPRLRNGVLLWIEVEDFDAVAQRAVDMGGEEPAPSRTKSCLGATRPMLI